MQQRLTPKEGQILLALAKYKFLTTSQLMTLWIANHKPNLSRCIKKLTELSRPLIWRNTFGFHPTKWRLEDIYYLTPDGAHIIIDQTWKDPEEVLLPKGKATLFSQDYYHRKNTVSIQIALSLAAQKNGREIPLYFRYFDKLGNARANTLISTTRIPLSGANEFLIPDFIFLVEQNRKQFFYCWEMYNGKDTKRVITQLKKHVKALETGAPSIKFNLDKANRVLSVFEHKSNLEAVLERIKEENFFANLEDFFLFKHLDDLLAEPFSQRTSLSGETVKMY